MFTNNFDRQQTRSHLFSKNSCKIFRPLNIHCTTFMVWPHCAVLGPQSACAPQVLQFPRISEEHPIHFDSYHSASLDQGCWINQYREPWCPHFVQITYYQILILYMGQQGIQNGAIIDCCYLLYSNFLISIKSIN